MTAAEVTTVIPPAPPAPSLLEELVGAGSDRQAASRLAMRGARHFTGDWFLDFCRVHFFHTPKDSAVAEPFEALDWQRRAWRDLLAIDDSGALRYGVIAVNWPRRHGKSQIAAMYDLTRCLFYGGQLVVIQGNSEEQGADTVMRWITSIIRLSPCFDAVDLGGGRLRAMFAPKSRSAFAQIPAVEIEVVGGEVRFGNGSLIQVRASNIASAYGRRISVYHNTEACVATGDDVYHAGASSTGDAWCGVTILDSNMGAEGGLVDRVTTAALRAADTDGAEGDPYARASYIRYDDLQDAVEHSLAPWLTAGFLRSRSTQMTAGEFLRNHCNHRGGAGSPAFSGSAITAARSARPWCAQLLGSVDPHSAWTTRGAYRQIRKSFVGASVRVGYGLDRAMGVTRGDRTVFAVWGVGVDPDLVGEPVTIYDDSGAEAGEGLADPRVYFPLAVELIDSSSASAVKRAVRKAQRLYGDPAGFALEQYQARDLADWAENEGLDGVQLRALTDGAKAAMTTRLSALFMERRVALSSARLGASHAMEIELRHYDEIPRQSRFPGYGARPFSATVLMAPGRMEDLRLKDDITEASLWAIEALADADQDENGGLYVG